MLVWIALPLGLQIVLYVLLRSKKEYVRILLFLLSLLLNLFILPAWYAEQLAAALNHPQCGMYMIGVYFGFWIIGGGLSVVTYMCSFLYSRTRQRKLEKLYDAPARNSK